MKKVIYLLFVSCFLAACQPKGQSGSSSEEATASASDSQASTNSSTTKIEFTESAFDFGTVQEGEKVTHAYTFKNTGEESLIISNAVASCGCTVPEWTREPIPPGGTGEIKAVFNSQGRVGKQSKSITVFANTEPAKTLLTLTGEVKAKTK